MGSAKSETDPFDVQELLREPSVDIFVNFCVISRKLLNGSLPTAAIMASSMAGVCTVRYCTLDATWRYCSSLSKHGN